MSSAVVLHIDFAQTAQKGWLNLLIATLRDISDDSLLLPVSLLFSGWSHWRREVAMPLGKLYPLAAVSMSAHWGPGPGSGSCWYRSQYGWRLAGPIGRDPSFPPWLSYRGVLLLTPVLCHLRGTQITCRSVRLSPFHTNSSALLLSLSLLVSLSLWGLLIHKVVCSHRTQYCRYVMQSKRLDDLSFSTACVSSCAATCTRSPGSEAPPSSSDFPSPSETFPI